ncbi:MAG: succinate dehydrogenase assembly factor 2 [Woeseia sp.]
MSPADRPSKSQLRWQCRRGMRELDVLLSAWLDDHFDNASDSQMAGFCSLLALPDPQLAGYLLQGLSVSDPDAANVVKLIRGESTA